MQKINRDNYEAYLLDYSEGNLSGELQVELELFLIQHPELNINLDDFALVSVNPEPLSFDEKQKLKKSDSDLIPEEQFIAYVEDQLSLNEKIELEKSCSNNESLAKELNLFKHTILAADTTIIFPGKNKLKHEPKIIWFNFSPAQYSIAASVLLLLSLYIFWPKPDSTGISADYMAFDLKSKQRSKYDHQIASVKEETQLSNSTTAKSSKKQSAHQPIPQINVPIANNVPSAKQESNSSPVTNIATDNSITKVEPKANQEENNIIPKAKTVVEVITEDDEEVAVQSTQKKKGFWSLAERTLKNLNAAGVKSVNGEKEGASTDNAYALTFGGVSITHKSN